MWSDIKTLQETHKLPIDGTAASKLAKFAFRIRFAVSGFC